MWLVTLVRGHYSPSKGPPKSISSSCLEIRTVARAGLLPRECTFLYPYCQALPFGWVIINGMLTNMIYVTIIFATGIYLKKTKLLHQKDIRTDMLLQYYPQ